MQFIRTDLDYKPDMKPLLKVVFEVFVVVDDGRSEVWMIEVEKVKRAE